VVLPIQDTQEPLDVLLDQLRALLGVGVGHLPADFELYDVERGTRFGRIRDLLDVVDAAWSGEPFDVSGQHGRWRGHVTPAPFGNKRPELVMGAHGPRGLALAGQRADLWLSDPQRHVDVVTRLAGQVRSAAGRQVRMRQPGGPGHEATLAAIARFGEEVIKPMGETR